MDYKTHAKTKTMKSQGKYPKGKKMEYDKKMDYDKKPMSKKEKFKAMLEKYKDKKKGKKGKK